MLRWAEAKVNEGSTSVELMVLPIIEIVLLTENGLMRLKLRACLYTFAESSTQLLSPEFHTAVASTGDLR